MKIYTELNNGSLNNFLEELKKKFESIDNHPPNTLFDVPLRWDRVKEDECPYCGKPLKFPLKRKVAYCKRKKCIAPNKGFLISLKALGKIKDKSTLK